MIFSTSTRASFKFTLMLFSTFAAMPVDSPIKPSSICSVPTKLWPNRRASSWANMTTLMACRIDHACQNSLSRTKKASCCVPLSNNQGTLSKGPKALQKAPRAPTKAYEIY